MELGRELLVAFLGVRGHRNPLLLAPGAPPSFPLQEGPAVAKNGRPGQRSSGPLNESETRPEDCSDLLIWPSTSSVCSSWAKGGLSIVESTLLELRQRQPGAKDAGAQEDFGQTLLAHFNSVP